MAQKRHHSVSEAAGGSAPSQPAAHVPAPVRVMRPRLPSASALLPYLTRIDATRVYSNYGPLNQEFAARLAALTGATGVTLTGNGTSAVELALRSLDKAGGVCLMPAFTFIASAHAVCNAGLVPFLLDVDPTTLALSPEIVEAALPTLPQRPAVVLVVSAFGAPPDFGTWATFETRHAIPVVFDAAAAVTSISSVARQPVCVSLHATKVLGIGEGGAILSGDPGLIERTTAMTGFGFFGNERISTLRAGNYRISEYTAAVGLAALDELSSRLDSARTLTAGYRRRLAAKAAHLQSGVGEHWLTMTLNAILPAADVAPTLDRFAVSCIEWRRWWGLGCHRHPAFSNLRRADLSGTDALAPRVIGVPFHFDLSEVELDRIAACLP
jgi:dTDP-4-amino-4,6-dideoxygalactose transaminase